MALMLDPAVRTHVGRRRNNEDAAFATCRVAAVADGVGGAAAGEVASRTMIDAVMLLDKSRLPGRLEDALAETLRWGNERIGFVAECRPQTAGMSTTLTAVALSNDGAYVIAHVGDSRAYLLRDGELVRLTRDDSLVQELLDRGMVTEAQARAHPQRSVVLAALDGSRRLLRSPGRAEARPGDRLLVCSDGLSDALADRAIASLLAAERDPGSCADRLVERALAEGARDNVTAVVADVVTRRAAAPIWPPAL